MNLCEFFDKEADNFDINNNFKIFHFPDKDATEMVAFEFQRRMECVLLPSDYFEEQLDPFLRMDPLTQTIVKNLLDDEVVNGKIHKDQVWLDFAREQGINTDRLVTLTAPKYHLDFRSYCKIWTEKEINVRSVWTAQNYDIDNEFQQGTTEDKSEDMFTYFPTHVFSYYQAYDPCKHINMTAETDQEMLTNYRFHQILFKKVMIDSPATFYDYFLNPKSQTGETVYYYHTSDNVDTFGMKINEGLLDLRDDQNFTMYVKLQVQTINLVSSRDWKKRKTMYKLPMDYLHLETITTDKVLADVGGFQGIILIVLVPLFNYLLIRRLRNTRIDHFRDWFANSDQIEAQVLDKKTKQYFSYEKLFELAQKEEARDVQSTTLDELQS